MSQVLIEFSRAFIQGRLSADAFSEAYVQLWKIEGDLGLLSTYLPRVQVLLSNLFLLADCYTPNPPRFECEIGANDLDREIRHKLQEFDAEGIDRSSLN